MSDPYRYPHEYNTYATLTRWFADLEREVGSLPDSTADFVESLRTRFTERGALTPREAAALKDIWEIYGY